MEKFEDVNEGSEAMEKMTFEVVKVADGLGFGTGTISGAAETMSDFVRTAVDEAIMTNPDLIVPVESDDDGRPIQDDGCGDGRGTALVTRAGVTLKRSLHRAKVFGGGLTMAVADRIGSGRAVANSLQSSFQAAAGDLDECGTDYGSHTDDGTHPGSCGCGAIDRAPEVISNVVAFKNQIRTTLENLQIPLDHYDQIINEFELFNTATKDQEFSGATVSDTTAANGKVVKQLTGSHKEKRIILNTVPDTAVNQQLIRDISGDAAQVFATDVWRLREIADGLHGDDTDAADRAFVSSLVYTLGVAGTLTAGDLPVYLVTSAS